jgi:hypothetical protein
MRINQPLLLASILLACIACTGAPRPAASTPLTLVAENLDGANHAAFGSDEADVEGALPPGLGPRPDPAEIDFDGCPAGGDGGDAALNRLKNRVDLPGAVNDATVAQVLGLMATGSKQHRDKWPTALLERVELHEGTPIRIEGYLVGVRKEGAESPNCHEDDEAHSDYHLYLVADAGDAKDLSIVVEMTPRVRAHHPSWTLPALRALVKAGGDVRISGWLMFDQEHAAEVGKSRGTLWEIHPITAVEVGGEGAWVPL